ncbi:MAG: hypothetical protein WBR56_05275, partial [Sedimenticolaceae bacterium]
SHSRPTMAAIDADKFRFPLNMIFAPSKSMGENACSSLPHIQHAPCQLPSRREAQQRAERKARLIRGLDRARNGRRSSVGARSKTGTAAP